MESGNEATAGAAELASADAPGLWSAVRASVRGSREDFTAGSISRAVVILAVPMMLELLMESTFGVVDVFFVGKLGADAVASVGIAGTLMLVVFSVALGLSMGTTAMVARRVGEGDLDGAAVASVQAILAGVIASIPISVVGAVFAPSLLGLMGASPAAIAGWSYTAILFGGSITVFLIFLINAIFRGAGDAVIAMRSLWLANALNIALDPCLIFGWGPFPEMGLAGAAVATTIGRGIGVAYQLKRLSGGGRLVITREHLRFDPGVMKRLVRVSVSGMLQFAVGMTSWVGLVRIVAFFGDAALAGMTIGVRVIHFAILPAWGLSNAAATLVGQNLGAKKPDRAERAVWVTGGYNLGFLCIVAFLTFTFAEEFIRVFTTEPEVISVGVNCLRIISCGYLAMAYGMVMGAAFNGSGDTDTPTVINFFCQWLLQLPLAYMLAHYFGWAASGVFTASVVAGTVWTLVGVTLFRRGRWKAQTI